MQATDVLHFWFEEMPESAWWAGGAAYDDLIRARFGSLHHAARRGELWRWRSTAEGRLGEIIVLDQFSRHLYRHTPDAFAADGLALLLAQEAVSVHAQAVLGVRQRPFLLMPFMHSESAIVQAWSVELFDATELEDSLESARQHQVIIERFGRFPHRNAVLGRVSTPAELEFLAQPGSSF